MNFTRPTLILDKKKCLDNIRFMADKVRRHHLQFRPHFKTHQSAQAGEWFRASGVSRITVSFVKMAEYFAAHNWKDITIAFPFNIRETDTLNRLAAENTINIVAESEETLNFLGENLKHSVNIFIKIDTGYHRTGIPAAKKEEIARVAGSVKQPLVFKGFLAHAGHSYHASSKDEILTVHGETMEQLRRLKEEFQSGYPDILLSLGDTPCCTLADDFAGMDEIRPGNFVFYDVYQYHLGVCESEQIAIALACPVVAKHRERNEIIVHGGAVHLSKDFITRGDGSKSFGLAVELNQESWGKPLKDTYVKSLSQEHGVLKAAADTFEKFQVGDVIGILPVHSCLTADAMKGYVTFDGKAIEHLEGVGNFY
jgi:D-serine deaminase-like pyridoxal phosphate-dependent protein